MHEQIMWKLSMHEQIMWKVETVIFLHILFYDVQINLKVLSMNKAWE